MSSPDDTGLPEGTGQFLLTCKDRKASAIVHQFHHFLLQSQQTLAQLEPWQVDQFLQRPFKTPLSRRTRYDYRGYLLNYLQWLYDKGALSFDPGKLRRGNLAHNPLPELAELFVSSLAVTLRESTCKSYRTQLRRFCRWCSEHSIEPEQLDRQQLSKWFAHLKDSGLSPETRCDTILMVRSYLRWLYECGRLVHPVDLLIRSTDLPKCPVHLPRPISPEADRELRSRLGSSSCRYQQGLLLMRNTGLRIGELVSLELDCLQTDAEGNKFLKVPIGKLYNERLVPVDAPTAELVHKLQCLGPQSRQWLLLSPKGCQTITQRYRYALREACEGIEINGRMTTHRLRHTYATTMLCGGMSLVGVMRLLGHRDYHMTLRYAAITQETVGREYFEALANIETRYQKRLQECSSFEPDPMRMLSDLTRWIQKHIAHDSGCERAALLLIKRLNRLECDLKSLMPVSKQS